MKKSALLKTLSIFLATTALLQVLGISSILVSGETIVQANAIAKSSSQKEKHIIASVEIQGDMIEGKTLTAVVKDSNGKDITQYCDFMWCGRNTPTTDYKTMLENSEYGVHELEDSKIILEKENIGNYIGIIVIGDYVDPNAPVGSSQLATKVLSTNAKVEANPLNHWYKIEDNENQVTDWYYLKDDGSRFIGWKQINGYWYYFKPTLDGRMVYGWKQINGKWYHFDSYGEMSTGWVKDVVIQKGQKNKLKYYYLYSDGSMASNTNIDGHYLDASGASTDDVDLRNVAGNKK